MRTLLMPEDDSEDLLERLDHLARCVRRLNRRMKCLIERVRELEREERRARFSRQVGELFEKPLN
jgi:hypothetical protein